VRCNENLEVVLGHPVGLIQLLSLHPRCLPAARAFPFGISAKM